MSIKTYSYVKYIATLGAVLIFLAPLLGFLEAWKDIFKANRSAEIITIVILEVLGIIVIGIYIFVRNRLRKKSTFEQTKKDRYLLSTSYALYILGIIFSLVYVIIAATMDPVEHKKAVMICFAPFYIFEFASLVGAAICESMSRVDEQIYLYQQEDERSQSSSETENAKYSDIGVKRTMGAQKLIDQEQNKSRSKKTKIDAEDYDNLQNALNDSKNHNEKKSDD